MSDPAQHPPITGQCLCGSVVVTLPAPKQAVELCQCSMCRCWGGAIFSAIGGADARVTGEDCVAIYQSSDWAERGFCRTCGSNLWFRFLPTGNRSFSAGLFEDVASFPIEREIFTDKAAAWCKLEGDHPRLTGAEVIAEAKAEGFTFD